MCHRSRNKPRVNATTLPIISIHLKPGFKTTAHLLTYVIPPPIILQSFISYQFPDVFLEEGLDSRNMLLPSCFLLWANEFLWLFVFPTCAVCKDVNAGILQIYLSGGSRKGVLNHFLSMDSFDYCFILVPHSVDILFLKTKRNFIQNCLFCFPRINLYKLNYGVKASGLVDIVFGSSSKGH